MSVSPVVPVVPVVPVAPEVLVVSGFVVEVRPEFAESDAGPEFPEPSEPEPEPDVADVADIADVPDAELVVAESSKPGFESTHAMAGQARTTRLSMRRENM
ncbi:MAG TPA: hypothetical protein ENJ18_13495 [Nannocystis exedens]|nr:hypothetical protein [Nannocystis exedens]